MAYVPHPDRRPALICGASSGIGASTAEMLAAAGYPVALAARRVNKLQEIVDRITSAGGEAVAVPLDVTDAASVTECVAKAQAALGDLEIVVNGAGDVHFAKSFEVTPEDFAAQVDIHLLGAFRVYRAVINGMIERGRGDIVFIGSDVAQEHRPWMAAYGAAKIGLDALASTAQLELEGTGVRVGVIRPGQVITGMGMDLDPVVGEKMLSDWVRYGFARNSNFLRPEHIAQAITTIVGMPRGAHMRAVEVEAEGAIPKRSKKATEGGGK
ncbi:SDR family oxidoreductase [Gordonia rhizosphera]|uniref:Putative oxidoreductase n=1 Tax=Gordonia rhizosphera NBRC 16068 TaxID=1108045 RepID=K6X1L0_9ACTN|nr:SDR family oxidoreductase [Gordonia rhizosphera]GAB92689.1 putative oxidoreductase [Gordonia rhizosphera NBRC 16068]